MIDIINEINNLHALKPSWDALANKQKSPLLQFDWFVTCAETIHAEDLLHVVVVRRNEDVVAIAPFFLNKRVGVPTLELMGSSVLHEPSAILYADQDSLNQLLQEAIDLGFPLKLLRLPDDPVLHAGLTAMNRKRGIVLRKKTAPSAFIALPSDWDTFLRSLSSSRRYDFRRKRKCLEKSGIVTTRFVSPRPAELPALLQQAMLVEDRSWKGREGSSLLKKPMLQAFFQRYLGKACAEGIVRLCYIDIDDRPISMHIALQSYQTFWVLKLGYDAALAKCSPGAQLAMDTIEYSVRQGLAHYEFLGSEEAWQQAWPIERHPYYTVLIYPYSLCGIRGLFGFATMFARKRLARFVARKKAAPAGS